MPPELAHTVGMHTSLETLFDDDDEYDTGDLMPVDDDDSPPKETARTVQAGPQMMYTDLSPCPAWVAHSARDRTIADFYDPTAMLVFYQRLFPFRYVFEWLNHSPNPTKAFTNREFAFTLENDVYLRCLSFATHSALEAYVSRCHEFQTFRNWTSILSKSLRQEVFVEKRPSNPLRKSLSLTLTWQTMATFELAVLLQISAITAGGSSQSQYAFWILP
jgi:hypothetical protein